MVSRYVLSMFGACILVLIVALTKLLIPDNHFNLFAVIIPALLFASVFLFKVRRYPLIQILNSLCIAYVLYGITFILIGIAGIQSGWENYSAIMYAAFAIVITAIANVVVWIGKRRSGR